MPVATIQVFRDWITDATDSGAAKEESLFKRAYRSLDADNKGYVTKKDFTRSFRPRDEDAANAEGGGGGPLSFLKKMTGKDGKPADEDDDSPLSLSEFETLISDHMVNKYYPKGEVVFEEGEESDSVYFINSGEMEVSTKAGFKASLSQGNVFVE